MNSHYYRRDYNSNSGCLWLILLLMLFGGGPILSFFFSLLFFLAPIFILGLIATAFMGRSVLRNAEIRNYLKTDSETHRSFVELLIGVLAKVALSDGAVDQREVKTIREFFQHQLRYSHAQLAWTRDVLKEALKSTVPIEKLCASFDEQFGYEEKLILIHLVYRVAFADGRLSNDEEALLKHIAALLQISEADHRSIRAQFTKEDEKAAAYATLGLGPGASAGEVKQAYRELSKKYHPDKVAHLGAEFRKVAEAKMKDINEAYNRLKT